MRFLVARFLLLPIIVSIACCSAAGQLLDLTIENTPLLPPLISTPPTTLLKTNFSSTSLPASSALIGFKHNNASAAQWMSLSDFATVLINRILPEQTAQQLTATARDAVTGMDYLAPENATAARNYFANQYGHFPQTTGEKVEAWVESSLQKSADNLRGKGMLDGVAQELNNANDAVRKLATLRFTVEHANVISDFIQRYNLDQQAKQDTHGDSSSSSLQDMYANFKDYVRVKRQAADEAAADKAEKEGEAEADAATSAIGSALHNVDSQISGAIGSVVGGVVGGVGGALGAVGGGLATGISAIPGGEMLLNATGSVVSTFTGGFLQVFEIGLLIVDQFVLSAMKIDGLFKPIKQLASMAFPPIGLVFDSYATILCFWTKKAKLFQMQSFGDFFSFLSCGMNYISMFQKGIGMIG